MSCLKIALLLAALITLGCEESDCNNDPLCVSGEPTCPGGACGTDTGFEAALPIPPDCTVATPGQLRLNEVLADPSGTDVNRDGVPHAHDDEYIEILNVSDMRVSTLGVSLSVNGSIRTLLEPQCLEPGMATVVFGGGAPALPNIAWELSTDPLKLTNTGAAVTLTAQSGEVLDELKYGDADGPFSIARIPDGDGPWGRHPERSDSQLAHSPGQCVNHRPFPDCGADTTPSAGGASETQPEAAVDPALPEPPPCPPVAAGELVINEVLADPGTFDSNGDGEAHFRSDEFVELVMVADSPRALNDVSLQVNGATKALMPDGCFPSMGAVVVLGDGPVTLEVPGVVAMPAAKALTLSNNGATISLIRAGASIAEVTYGKEGAKDQSLNRHPELVGELTLHTSLATEAAASPGTCADGTALADGCALPEEPSDCTD